jgi:hypothetical protein
MAANNSSWLNGYRYLFRNVKPYWDKHGGKICTFAGTTGLFLTGVHACRTTYKHHDELRENGARIRRAGIRKVDEKSYKRYLRVAKETALCSLRTARHYAPDIVAASLSSYVTSKGWGIEHQHYEQAATMVGVLAADFLNYRKNVISEHGVEADRRYMTAQKQAAKILEAELEDGTKLISNSDGNDGSFTVSVDPTILKIWYSKETTPQVWSPSYALRIAHLKSITNELDCDLMYAGHVSVNDIRRAFYGKKGEVGCGGIFGRIWDPEDPQHPERGRLINLHYEEDLDFMEGRTDSCWIFIDIDDEPLFESMATKPADIPGVEFP